MSRRIAFIGFGEAAQAFAGAAGWSSSACAYDTLTDDPAQRDAKLADCARCGVEAADSAREALRGADLILSLVTAEQALPAAQSVAPHIRAGALYCEMNSVAPETKKLGAAVVEQAGGRFVDVAIMSPVGPARLAAPLLLSGPAALAARRALREAGFEQPRTVGRNVGDAAAIKMIRSVVVKGVEALTVEAMLAAAEAGVVDEVLASLDASDRAMSWAERADYNLGRIMTHGVRRAEEMVEAARTLESLGVEPALTRGTVLWQREIGGLGRDPERGISAKLAQLRLARTKVA